MTSRSGGRTVSKTAARSLAGTAGQSEFSLGDDRPGVIGDEQEHFASPYVTEGEWWLFVCGQQCYKCAAFFEWK